MPFFLTTKSISELSDRSWRERRLAISIIGLKPFRHWQVWAALTLTSFVLLWAIETIAGNLIWNKEVSATLTAYIVWATIPLVPFAVAGLIYQHTYLKALRRYITFVSFEQAPRLGATLKGLLTGMASIPLAVCLMFAIDWTINSFDDSPDPRIATLMNWPAPVPDSENGYIASVSMEAPVGTNPFEAGRRWIARNDEIVLSHSGENPNSPEGLIFTEYSAKDAPGKPVPRKLGGIFCRPGAESCLDIAQREQAEIRAWLAANRELLVRYQSLHQYPQWQYPTSPGMVILPRYSSLLRGQSLLHASALLALGNGQTGKAVEMIASDFRFVRRMMGAKDVLIGKMIAATLYLRDLAVLSDVIQRRPRELAPHWDRIEKMLGPLTINEVSTADTFRFEGKWGLAHIERLSYHPNPELDDYPEFVAAWMRHHFKPNSVMNHQLDLMDRLAASVKLTDANYTPIYRGNSVNPMQDISRVSGFMHNQLGKLSVITGSSTNYFSYANKLIDLNALNNLVHLQAALTRNRILAKDVPTFLAGNDMAQCNPETGKPFEWDGNEKEIYFIPATESYRKDLHLSGTTPGRMGIRMAERISD
jgi:hypothetical protein